MDIDIRKYNVLYSNLPINIARVYPLTLSLLGGPVDSTIISLVNGSFWSMKKIDFTGHHCSRGRSRREAATSHVPVWQVGPSLWYKSNLFSWTIRLYCGHAHLDACSPSLMAARRCSFHSLTNLRGSSGSLGSEMSLRSSTPVTECLFSAGFSYSMKLPHLIDR